MLKHKEKIWSDFLEQTGFSSASVSRYIKIAEHPVIRNKKYHARLPSSVYSLYEISGIESKKLLQLINMGNVRVEMGRSEILALKQPTSKTKTQVEQVDLITIKIPKDSLKGDFYKILNEVSEFLNSKDLYYDYGKEIKKLEEKEKRAHEKIEKYVFSQAKRFFNKTVKAFVEAKGIQTNKWQKNSRISFKAKARKIGFNTDEVSVDEATSIEEIEQKYLLLGIEDSKYWNSLVTEWHIQAHQKYGENFASFSNSEADEMPTREEIAAQKLASGTRGRRKNFTGVKLKV